MPCPPLRLVTQTRSCPFLTFAATSLSCSFLASAALLKLFTCSWPSVPCLPKRTVNELPEPNGPELLLHLVADEVAVCRGLFCLLDVIGIAPVGVGEPGQEVRSVDGALGCVMPEADNLSQLAALRRREIEHMVIARSVVGHRDPLRDPPLLLHALRRLAVVVRAERAFVE